MTTPTPLPECRHLAQIGLKSCTATILNPDRWLCFVAECETADTVRMCLICGSSYCDTHGEEHYKHKRCRHAWFLHLNTDENSVYCRGCENILDIPTPEQLASGESTLSDDEIKKVKQIHSLCERLQRVRTLQPNAEEDEDEDEDEDSFAHDEEHGRGESGTADIESASPELSPSVSDYEDGSHSHDQLASFEVEDIFSTPHHGTVSAKTQKTKGKHISEPPTLFRATSVAAAVAAAAAIADVSDDDDNDDGSGRNENDDGNKAVVSDKAPTKEVKLSRKGHLSQSEDIALQKSGRLLHENNKTEQKKSGVETGNVAGTVPFLDFEDQGDGEEDVNDEKAPSPFPMLVRNPSLSLQLSYMSTPRVARKPLNTRQSSSRNSSPQLAPKQLESEFSELGKMHGRTSVPGSDADDLSFKRIRQGDLNYNGEDTDDIIVRRGVPPRLSKSAEEADQTTRSHDLADFYSANWPIPKPQPLAELVENLSKGGESSSELKRFVSSTNNLLDTAKRQAASRGRRRRAQGEPGEFRWLKFLSIEAARQREKIDLLYTACFRWRYGRVMNAFARWRSLTAASASNRRVRMKAESDEEKNSPMSPMSDSELDSHSNDKSDQNKETQKSSVRRSTRIQADVTRSSDDIEVSTKKTRGKSNNESAMFNSNATSNSAEMGLKEVSKELDEVEDVTKKLKGMRIFNTRGVCGLRNLGNTCYLNAVLQAFSHTEAVRAYFLAHVNEHSDQSFVCPSPSGKLKKRLKYDDKFADKFAFKPPKNHNEDKNCCWTVDAPRPPPWSRTMGFSNRRTRTKAKDLTSIDNDEMNDSDSTVTKQETQKDSSNQTPLSDCVAHLLHTLWTGKRIVFSPDSMIHKVWSLQPRFRGFIQHDAQEFTLFFLDQLSKEQKVHRDHSPLPDEYRAFDPSKLEELERDIERKEKVKRLADEAKQNGHKFEEDRVKTDTNGPPPVPSFHDIIKNQFTGAIRTRIDCLECGHVAVKDNPFLGVVSLCLPDPSSDWVPPSRQRELVNENVELAGSLNGGDSNSTPINSLPSQTDESTPLEAEPMPPKRSRGTRSKAPPEPAMKLTLDDILSFNYATSERLEGSNAYSCDKCKKHSTAELKTRLGALPSRYLLLHLVRTSFDMKTLRPKKNQADVRFPLKNLDLSKYMDRHGENDKGDLPKTKDKLSSPTLSSPNYKYDLFAVVTHHGRGMQEGHFTSCAWNPLAESWLLFNDATVKRIEPEDLESVQAYMLFYQRSDSIGESHFDKLQ